MPKVDIETPVCHSHHTFETDWRHRLGMASSSIPIRDGAQDVLPSRSSYSSGIDDGMLWVGGALKASSWSRYISSM